MDTFLLDFKYAMRGLWRGRFFASATTLTLGLGIGVITALFAVIDAVLLQPLVPDQDRVVLVMKRDVQRGNFPAPLSLQEFERWRGQTRSFDAVAAVDHAATGPVPLTIDGQATAVRMSPVSAGFFQVVSRGAPLYGRWLHANDERVGADVVAVVSERFWRRVSGGDPSFVGRRLTWAGDRTLVVIGVAPASVDYPLGTDIWAPGATIFDGRAGRFDGRTLFQFELLGRLKRGVTADQARAELQLIHRRLSDEFPKVFGPMQVAVEPVLDGVVGNGRRVLIALFAAGGLVFAIAGVNVAALLLMRTSERRMDVAIRVALGAGYGRLLRQTVAEGLVLGTLAAICGLAIARSLLLGLQYFAPGDMPRVELAALDLRVLAFCVGAALLWVLTLGTVPMYLQRGVARAPRSEHAFRGVRGTRGLLAFTTLEVAAAVIVAIGAGLLIRTFAQLQAIDRGFNSTNLLNIRLLLPESRQRDPRAMLALYRDLLPQLETLPGVESASPVHVGPGSGTLGLSAPMMFEGQSTREAATNPWSTWEPVLPSYFGTMGIPIAVGRAFETSDRSDGVPVAIVSEGVAQRYWPGQNPLGKRLKFVDAADWPWVTVVGVVADNRYRELTKPWMTVYFPADQFFFFQAASLVVRTTAAPDALVPAILDRVRAIEPSAAIESVASMNTLLDRELARPRAAVTVTSLFALMAMALAAIGIYGVLSYEVRQRRQELAVRAAVGASPADIARAVLQRSLLVGAVGATIGVIAATAATRALRSLLFEVQPLDPLVFATAAVGLVALVLVAAYFPARRAAGSSPLAALRSE